MFRPKILIHQVPYHAPQVSILVLVDVSPEGNISSTMTRRSTVSILVLVDVSPEGFTRLLKPELSRVSILVLVDVSPEDMIGAVLGVSNTGFNPCSRGCFARSVCALSIPRPRSEVSILVLVDVSPEDDRIKRRIIGCTVSILVLVDVSPEVILMVHLSTNSVVSILVLVDVSPEAGLRRSAGTRVPVSILVLVDVSPEVVRHPRRKRRGSVFQSLFSWMFRPKNPPTAPRTTATGFNPCSRGCFARRCSAPSLCL